MANSGQQERGAGEDSVARSMLWATWTLITHLIAGVVLLGAFLWLVPEFRLLFEEFDADLPRMTIVAIDLSVFVARYWYLILFVGVGVDAGLLFGLSRLPPRTRWLGTVWASLVLVVALLGLAFLAIGIVLPLQALITQLS